MFNKKTINKPFFCFRPPKAGGIIFNKKPLIKYFFVVIRKGYRNSENGAKDFNFLSKPITKTYKILKTYSINQ
jgi:hypothetical protein